MLRVEINLKIDNDNYKEEVVKLLKIKSSDIKTISINKKSVDARRRDAIHYHYSIDIELESKLENELLKNKKLKLNKVVKEEYQIPKNGSNKLENRPIIVGSGPAGLFAAYLLASKGFHPLVIDRGEEMIKRVKTVNTFLEKGTLNEESNVSFGEGGAGTFSDGKLKTMIRDKEHRGKKVFDIFIENGADSDILYLQHPHLGTDKLKEIIPSIRNKIIKMGGEFRFSTKLTDIKIENEKVVAVTLNDKEQLPCNVLILAIGHSARDTFHLLDDKNLLMESKSFAVGVRVMHYQKMIDKEQYQNKIKKAPYKLTYQTKNHRGVYSFCMCPGGYVINSASENNSLVVNGMSNYLRDSNTANSAIVVTVSKKDYGEGLFAGVKYQQELEKKAYLKGNGKIPVEYYQDFLNKKITKKETDFAILGAYTFTDLNDILPVTISDSIKEAMIEFNKKIKNFSDSNPLLAGVETRTSSPIKIIRDEKLESNIKGIYPCGEGSGYAGGITSSAIDGIKVAEEIIKKYYY